MIKYKNLPNTFIKNFQKITKKTVNKLNDYLDEPSEQNIHDIRISIRRLESACRILPKKIKKQPIIQDYIKQSTMLFKTNTGIRDYDIIINKFEQYLGKSSSRMISSLMIKRKTKLRDACIIASKLKSLPIPKITEKQVSEQILKKRFQKIIDKLNSRMKQNIPIVLNDDSKIEELHRLRKDFKKLRYTLELAIQNKKTYPYIKNFKKIQDTLGEIHDSDIMLDYLKNYKMKNDIEDLTRKESVKRDLKYKMFVKTFSEQRFDFEKLIG